MGATLSRVRLSGATFDHHPDACTVYQTSLHLSHQVFVTNLKLTNVVLPPRLKLNCQCSCATLVTMIRFVKSDRSIVLFEFCRTRLLRVLYNDCPIGVIDATDRRLLQYLFFRFFQTRRRFGLRSLKRFTRIQQKQTK